ncbi:MAG: hypothetical protein V3V96_13970 [Acidiferrobacterales bacterium]
MEAALGVIDAKVGSLRQQLAAAEGIIERERAQVNRIGAQIEALEDVRRDLEAEQDVADAGVDILVDVDVDMQIHGGNGQVAANSDVGPKPSRAIIALLKENPGLQRLEIVDALIDRVHTTAKNPRHNLRTTIYNLEKRGEIRQDDDERFYVADE